jgi:predicted dehydrogenase
MGRHHIRILASLAAERFQGFFDANPRRSAEISQEFHAFGHPSLESLLDRVEAVVIAAPTSDHYELGMWCLDRGVHVMMEKPLAHGLEQAEALVAKAEQMGVILMAGHVERYNPAIRKLMELLAVERLPAVSAEARRLAPFDGSRCMDVDVLYDLLIHDVDLILEIFGSSPEWVCASGRPVFSSILDVVHAQAAFPGGGTAVLWAGKCSPLKARTLTAATPRLCVEADTLANTLKVWEAGELPDPGTGLCFMGAIECRDLPVPPEEPLRCELEDFLDAIGNGRTPIVSGRRALESLRVLDMIACAVNRPPDRGCATRRADAQP